MSEKEKKEEEGKNAFKALRMSEHWQNYLYCISVHLIFPLLPMVFSIWKDGQIEEGVLMLSTAMYAMTIGVSSNHRGILGTAILVSFIFSMAYGASLKEAPTQENTLANSNVFAYIAIGIMFLIHLYERYIRHILDKESFNKD